MTGAPWESSFRSWVNSGISSGEGADAGNIAAHNQSLDVLGAFIGVDRLDVGHVPYHVVVEQDAVAAQQVPRFGDHLTRLEGVVHLGQCGDRVGEFSLLFETTHA